MELYTTTQFQICNECITILTKLDYYMLNCIQLSLYNYHLILVAYCSTEKWTSSSVPRNKNDAFSLRHNVN